MIPVLFILAADAPELGGSLLLWGIVVAEENGGSRPKKQGGIRSCRVVGIISGAQADVHLLDR